MNAFIFDMDGVIFDSERLYIECCVEAASQLGMENIMEICHRCIGVTTDVTEAVLLETYRDADLVKRFRELSVALFRDKYRRGLLKMKPGVREVLGYLRHKGLKTAIASSTKTEIVEKELKEAGIWSLFQVIVGGDQVLKSKPSPDIFLRAAELLGEKPESCVVIEDAFTGIRAAKAAGMTAIMVPDQLQPDSEIQNLADVIVPSLFQVVDLNL